MSVLSDHIESFIKELLGEEDGTCEIGRNDLAQKFNCAPSQINYVLTTRFSPSRGYVIESRRGGGGYIRVIRLDIDRSDYILDMIGQSLSGQDGISMRQAAELVDGLLAVGFIDKKMRGMILAAISDKALLVPDEYRDVLRKNILKEILISII
ncbi:MAG: CtsR family transcriptional regulator [Christensenellaceae bacterium]|jgi:transcriptional regulator CtsR